jgi:hypothetical protein
MERPINPVVITGVPGSIPGGAPPRPAADVPSEQLWREAISAARQAATGAAELRRALEAARLRTGRPTSA